MYRYNTHKKKVLSIGVRYQKGSVSARWLQSNSKKNHKLGTIILLLVIR